MKKLLLIAAIVLLLGGNAYALIVPTINGIAGVNEWNGSQLFGVDTPEAGIDDSWDIQSIYMKVIAGNGWYFRMDTFGGPTFAGGPGSFGEEAAFKFFLDIDDDSVPEYLVDLNDRNYTAQRKVSVYGAAPAFPELGVTGTGNAAISSIIEFYVPDSMLSTDIFFDNAALNPFAVASRLEGNGNQADDNMPNSGFIKTPEPASMSLLGLGLVSLFGVLRRKKAKA